MATATIDGPQIISIIGKIKREVGALAPSRSDGVPFPFRGIDGVVNHLVGKINEYGVVTLPEVIESKTTERSQGNRTVKTTDITVMYTFYAPDGSFVTATTQGLADDYADRSAAQAQSVAFRVALLQTFFLPTQSPEPEQTGQKVKDHVHDGATEPQQPQAVARAAAGSTTKPPTKAAQEIEVLRNELKAVAAEVAEKSDGALKPDFYLQLAKDKKLAKGWPTRVGDLNALIKAVKNGEVPSA